MIGPKAPKPSKGEERAAYSAATDRGGGRCARCSCSPVQRDHRKNRSQGGLTTLANLQLLCVTCHQWKTENPADALVEGFAVPSYARPELWPAWHVGIGWLLYLDGPDENGRLVQPINESTAHMLMGGGR
ncbi:MULTISPECIES: HNH endonuclease [unclassified Microbacterium]|uniref:HNH endonuclease n=1 Tax=unclassified Microbacterium TaxID=2609290 RepID=UPI00301045E8